MPPPREPDRRVRVGIDIVGVDRVARLVTTHPASVAELFTAAELAYCRGKRRCHEHMAARFAAKEAILKAFGTGFTGGMRWTDIEIRRGAHGRPVAQLHGTAARWAERHGLADLDVSLSHAGGMAIAHAVTVWTAG